LEQSGHANNFRRTVTELTGEQDVDSILEREIAEVATGHADAAVAEARAALSRMDDGSYGMCEHCRGLVPFERLEAIPQTRFCVGCAAIA
jgi:RNA polymerase-binding transcription factor DksA